MASMSEDYQPGDLAAPPDSALGRLELLTEEQLNRGTSSGGIRGLVSKKKKRFVEMGFDLDLAYVTPRVVAMGFPSSGMEGLYRNPLPEVVRFLQIRHQDHFKLYNLCSEANRVYDSGHFGGRVEQFPFDDHNAPPFEMIRPFCLSVQAFLDEHPDNVVCVHCKAGKGRTGLMICALLLHSGVFTDASKAMTYYGRARTLNGKGLTIPSQRRYVGYYADLLRDGPRSCPQLRLIKLRMRGCAGLNPLVIVRAGRHQFEGSFEDGGRMQDDGELEVPLAHAVVCGDVKVEVFHQSPFGKKKLKLGFWFHTGFVEGNRLIMKKSELDKAFKDKKHRAFPSDMSVCCTFELLSEASPFQHSSESGIVSAGPSASSAATALGNQATAVSSIPSPAMELGKPELMRVLFDYDVPDAGHLSISAGQLIYVLKKHESGWWLASFDGKVGWIPQKYAAKVGAKSSNNPVSIV